MLTAEDHDRSREIHSEPRSFVTDTALAALCFAASRRVISEILLRFPQYTLLDPARRVACENAANGTLHALAVTVWSVRCLTCMMNSPAAVFPRQSMRDQRVSVRMSSFMTGYFLHDVLVARRELLKNPSSMLHHTLYALHCKSILWCSLMQGLSSQGSHPHPAGLLATQPGTWLLPGHLSLLRYRRTVDRISKYLLASQRTKAVEGRQRGQFSSFRAHVLPRPRRVVSDVDSFSNGAAVERVERVRDCGGECAGGRQRATNLLVRRDS
jgi:hypothetical protein